MEEVRLQATRPIGVLDSGVGGLTVVKELMRQMPYESIVYIGDSARCPYGSRPKADIRQFTMEMVHFLLSFSPKLIVIACNTATAVALEDVRRNISIPVIGVVEPGARAAIREGAPDQPIGVIGTEATITSGVYEETLKRTQPDLTVKSVATPELVPLVEMMWPEEAAYPVVKKALEPILKEPVGTLVLGCTHYPLLAPLIQKAVGEKVTLISSARETANEVARVLSERDLLAPTDESPYIRLFTTGDDISFRLIASRWLEREDLDIATTTLVGSLSYLSGDLRIHEVQG
ncbi:MAG: glutamate racemase [Candidatus Carbobacillus altaicus]|uniref:Glutamate racemase n=1 Tax=Candidatus Carbonibacillus altaicus TaxID=2163959 RepID=A0A2R6Y5C0_9BACL|nr:glutamate racemase [Candidatus Carbobacillus altaicus]PTQ57876.1 MAG: Glutamate racemase [Candidatus Carbobacillus altaicus]